MKMEPELTAKDLDTWISASAQLLQQMAGRVSPRAALDHFLRTIYYGTQVVVPYDWMSECERGTARTDDAADLASLDLDALRKRFILHVRRDRFEEGHLLALVGNGYLKALLERAKTLRGTP